MQAVLLNLRGLLDRELTEGVERPDNIRLVSGIVAPYEISHGRSNIVKMITTLCCICWPRESKQEIINPSQDYSLEAESVVVVGAILQNRQVGSLLSVLLPSC